MRTSAKTGNVVNVSLYSASSQKTPLMSVAEMAVDRNQLRIERMAMKSVEDS